MQKQRYFFLTNFSAGSNGEPARMLKRKKVEKLFSLDQMVVKRLCNNVVEKLKKIFPAVTDGVTATMLKCGSNKKYFPLYQMVIQREC